MDSSGLPSLADIKGGPVSSLTRKPLLSIVAALKLSVPDKITVPELKVAVKEALSALEAAADEHFQKFVIYPRFGSAKAPVQTGADKSQQDAAAAKEDTVPSGTNTKFLTKDTKTDPPPQYKRLGGDHVKSKVDDDGNDVQLLNPDKNLMSPTEDLSLLSSDTPPEDLQGESEHELAPSKPVNVGTKKDSPGSVAATDLPRDKCQAKEALQESKKKEKHQRSESDMEEEKQRKKCKHTAHRSEESADDEGAKAGPSPMVKGKARAHSSDLDGED
ncbi:hypothetical protein B0H10DRAFT_1953663 [Mycena sp. CBHHK59/15]|nr:hypothetical protein B0H10DRAFT_1953663 [Mycena sp. CBHHK59/15]